jgi:hypothetical protein
MRVDAYRLVADQGESKCGGERAMPMSPIGSAGGESDKVTFVAEARSSSTNDDRGAALALPLAASAMPYGQQPGYDRPRPAALPMARSATWARTVTAATTSARAILTRPAR